MSVRRFACFAIALAACSSTPAGTGGTSGSASSTSSSTSTGSSASSGSGASSSGASGSSGSGSSGSSGSTGGAPLLRFAFTGDTRPDNCDDLANYPSPVMDQIIASMRSQNVAFALDTGDHVKVCGSDSDSKSATSAEHQLTMYAGSVAGLGAPFYLTMGNHECHDNGALCTVSDPVLGVFLGYQQRAVATTTPYYAFDVATAHGVATFIFVADTAWDATQSAWLESALSHGDASAYTIVAKHVPSSNVTDFATNADEMAIIERHRFALLLDAHAHTYAHSGEAGREVTLGLGGAPLDDPTANGFGFGLVAQQSDGTLTVSIFDAASSTPRDAFTVLPN